MKARFYDISLQVTDLFEVTTETIKSHWGGDFLKQLLRARHKSFNWREIPDSVPNPEQPST